MIALLGLQPHERVEHPAIEQHDVRFALQALDHGGEHGGRGPRVEEEMPFHRDRAIGRALAHLVDVIPTVLEETVEDVERRGLPSLGGTSELDDERAPRLSAQDGEQITCLLGELGVGGGSRWRAHGRDSTASISRALSFVLQHLSHLVGGDKHPRAGVTASQSRKSGETWTRGASSAERVGDLTRESGNQSRESGDLA
jgi:hypothetical protein